MKKINKHLLIYLIIVLIPAVIWAQALPQILSTAKELYLAGNYESAIKELKTVIENEAANTQERYEAHFYLGLCYLILEDAPAPAQQEFQKAIELIPDKEIDREIYSLKVVDLFEKAKKEYEIAREAEKKEQIRKKEEEKVRVEKELEEQMREEQERLAEMRRKKEAEELRREKESYQRLRFVLGIQNRGDLSRNISFKKEKNKVETRTDLILLKLGMEKRDALGVYLEVGAGRIGLRDRQSRYGFTGGLAANYYLKQPEVYRGSGFSSLINFRAGSIYLDSSLEYKGEERKITWLESEAALLLGMKNKTWSFYAGPNYSMIIGEYRFSGKDNEFQEEKGLGLVMGAGLERKWFNLKAELKLINKIAASFGVEF